METLLDEILKAHDLSKRLSDLINTRLKEFSNRFGEDVFSVFGSDYVLPHKISFDFQCDEGLITWRYRCYPNGYPNPPDIYQKGHYHIDLLQEDKWNKFIMEYQKIFDKRIEESKLARKNKLLSEIKNKEDKLQKLKDQTEIDNTIKSIEEDLIKLKSKLSEGE